MPAGLTYGDLTTQTTAGDAFYQNTSAGFLQALTDVGGHAIRPTERVAGLQIFAADDGKFKKSKDDGQYGIKLTSYIDQAGGIDLSIYFANYHSKAPYIRLKGQKGLFAGDLYGIMTTAVYDQMDNNFSALSAFTTGGARDGFMTGNTFGQALINGIQEVAYSSGVCIPAIGKAYAAIYSAGSTGTKYTTTAQERGAWANLYSSTTITGEKSKKHDPNKCLGLATASNATTDARHVSGGVSAFGSASANSKTGGAKDANLAIMGTGAIVAAAITPINYFEYDFVFPEDNQILGTSFSTVVDGTVVQGEVSYRPDFPLATPASSQINQLADASGATQLLNWLAFNGVDGLGQTAATTGDATGDGLQLTLGLQVLANGGAYSGGAATTESYTETIRDFKRSSLAAISTDTVKAGDYYSTPYLNYDVWSADIGAYVVGKIVGGPKLAPSISPGKTWSGAVGGQAAAMIISVVFSKTLLQDQGIMGMIFLGGATCVASQIGDLLQSYFKRVNKVKDSGKLIPGHGGVLDRIDGILLAAPVACVLIPHFTEAMS